MVLTDTGLAKVFQRIKSFVIAQLNSKASAVHTHTVSDISDLSTNYVTTDTTQTIRGNKYFNGNFVEVNGYRLRIKNIEEVAGELPTAKNPWTSNRWNAFNYVDKNNVRTFEISRGAIGNGWTFVNFGVLNNVSNTWFDFLKYEGNSSVSYVSSIDFVPRSNNTYELGSSTNKWKTFNGINPGVLSLPSSTYIDVDTTNWDLTCQNGLMGSFTPTADGWLMLHVANSGTSEVNFWIIGGVIRINSKSSINTTDNNSFNMITIPVEKDKTYNIYGNASEYVAGRSIRYCRFMPCQGNV